MGAWYLVKAEMRVFWMIYSQRVVFQTPVMRVKMDSTH